ncbi:MAG: ComF family protein [Ruminococcaceae bacterium]|nr:ComF family protein [Oscillospiraceae bacterium]
MHKESIWSKGKRKSLDLLFPRKCPFCQSVTDGALLCDVCNKKLPYTGSRAVHKGTFGRCAAPLFYEGTVREAILRYKFARQFNGLDCFAQLMAQCAAEHFAGEFDAVTWVPVSRKRLRERGFDQAFYLARGICDIWQVTAEETLRKTVNNTAQSSLAAAEERRSNVLGVYEIREGAEIAGRRFLLVDDILTTGATLTEARRVLLEAGAAQVLCLTLAAVPQNA